MNSTPSDLRTPTDVELVCRYRNGDISAFTILMKRHSGLIYSITKDYFMQGAEHSDIWQEGCIGFYKAVRDFDLQHNFPTFAALCVKRQVLSAVKMASARKHSFLTGCSWIEDLADEPRAVEAGPDAGDPTTVAALLDLLTPMERLVMTRVLDGYSTYQEISGATGYSTKSVDNAVWRSRRKIRQALAA